MVCARVRRHPHEGAAARGDTRCARSSRRWPACRWPRCGDRPPAEDGPERDAVRRAPVVVGTEAVLHRVPRADAVAFLDFDSELLAPRFRAAEEALALLARPPGSWRGPARGAAVTGPRAGCSSRPASPGTPRSWPRCRPIPACWPPQRPRCGAPSGLPPFSALAVVSGPAADAYGAALRGRGARRRCRGARARRRRAGRCGRPITTRCATCWPPCRGPPGRLRVEVDPVRA